MRSPTKSEFAVATILAASFGFAGLTKAAPLAGMVAAVPALPMTQVQMAQEQEPSAAEAMPEKAHHHGYAHKGKMKMEEHHHHHHHHHAM
jgi:hypothetical protein